jgi:hypothetical protein
MGIIGFNELDRGGHRRFRRILRISLITWLAILGILVVLITHYKATAYDFAVDYSICLFWLLFAALFPLALYLNRNRKDTTSQATMPNAR